MHVEVIVLGLLLTVDLSVAEFEVLRNQCMRTGMFQVSEKDRALIGYKMDTHQVHDEIDCGRWCLSRDGCKSYNYQYEVNHTQRHTCEISSHTKEAKPEAFRMKVGFQYYGFPQAQKKPIGCAKYACHNGGTCVDTCHGDMFHCQCTNLFRGKQCERPKARNCKELYDLGVPSTGAQRVAPDDQAFGISVYCDQTTDGGGWLVVQRRNSPFGVLFSKNWSDYETGFGSLSGSFWIGNRYLSRLTTIPVQLRIELKASAGAQGYAVYENFSISGPRDNYRLSVGRNMTGTIGNAINGDSNMALVEDGMQFSTGDRDNDGNYLANCAVISSLSGWWLNNCGRANLNSNPPQWDEWKFYDTSINYTEMKIRPMKQPFSVT